MSGSVNAVRTIAWKKDPEKGEPGKDGKDGKDGAPGKDGAKGAVYLPRGEWNANAIYIKTTEVIHFVTFEGYAYEPTVASVQGGNNPKADVQNGGGKWKAMGSMEIVATRVLLANFALMAGAVIWNNKFMSQYGIDDNGDFSDTYIEYAEDANTGQDTGTFHPNLLLDFLTGGGHFAQGNFRWDGLGNVSVMGSLALPYKTVTPVNNGILDLSEGSYFFFDLNNYGQTVVYLPKPCQAYNGCEVRIFSGFLLTRSSDSTFTLRIDGGRLFFYPGYQPYAGSSALKAIKVVNRQICVRCLPSPTGYYLWYLENYADFAPDDLLSI